MIVSRFSQIYYHRYMDSDIGIRNCTDFASFKFPSVTSAELIYGYMDFTNLELHACYKFTSLALRVYVCADFTNSRIRNNTNLANLQLRGLYKFSVTCTEQIYVHKNFANLELHGCSKFTEYT